MKKIKLVETNNIDVQSSEISNSFIFEGIILKNEIKLYNNYNNVL